MARIHETKLSKYCSYKVVWRENGCQESKHFAGNELDGGKQALINAKAFARKVTDEIECSSKNGVIMVRDDNDNAIYRLKIAVMGGKKMIIISGVYQDKLGDKIIPAVSIEAHGVRESVMHMNAKRIHDKQAPLDIDYSVKKITEGIKKLNFNSAIKNKSLPKLDASFF